VTRRNETTPAAPVARNYDYQLTDIMQPSYTPGVAELDDARAIDVTLIDPNPDQPRRTFDQAADQAALEKLGASIRRHGVLQPILVRPIGTRYQIIAGERRWRAAQLAGLTAIPSILRDITDDDEVDVLALLENVHRQDLTPLDEAHSYQRLLERLHLSKRGLADTLDLNHTHVNNRLLLIENPAIEQAVQAGTLGVTVAQELARAEDPALQQKLIERAAQGERVRVRDVKSATPPSASQHAPTSVEINFHATTDPHPAPIADSQRIDQGDASAVDTSDVEINFHATTPSTPHRVDLDQPTTAPLPASTPQASAAPPPAEGSTKGVEEAVDPGQVRLRDLRIIQLHTGRDSEPRQFDTADRATVLRVLRADLAWLEDIDRRATREASAHD